MNNKNSLDVIVVGHTFSGLVCAHELTKLGHHVTLVPGKEDFLPHIPTLQNNGNTIETYQQYVFENELEFHNFLYSLDLFPDWKICPKNFYAFHGTKHHSFNFGPKLFFFPHMGIYEKFLFTTMNLKISNMSRSQIMNLDIDQTAELYLLDAGFAPTTVDGILSSVFGSLIHEKSLKHVSRRIVQSVWKNLLTSHAMTYPSGMKGLYEEILKRLEFDGVKIVYEACESLRPHPMAQNDFFIGIKTSDQKYINADKIILCTEASQAVDLLQTFDEKICAQLKPFCKEIDVNYMIFEADSHRFSQGICIPLQSQEFPLASLKTFKVGETTYLNVVSKERNPDVNGVQYAIECMIPELKSKLKFLSQATPKHLLYHQPEGFRVKCPDMATTRYKNLFLGGRFLTDSSLEGAILSGKKGARELHETVTLPPQTYHRAFASTQT